MWLSRPRPARLRSITEPDRWCAIRAAANIGAHVLTLGYSRKSVRLLVFQSSSQTWAELHEKAFRRLGGVTRVVVLDNLRESVLAPNIYDRRSILFTATRCNTMAPSRCLAAWRWLCSLLAPSLLGLVVAFFVLLLRR